MSPSHPTFFQTYAERSEHPSNTPLATYLLRLIHVKRTNLCVSADVTTTAELLRVAEEVGDYICVLKTHADIIGDFTDRTIRLLTAVARRRKFVVFEDRKFGDIGNTVQLQYTGGPLSIVQWAPIVNAHLFPGPAIITALAQAAQKSIAQYNTSVSTDISASPARSVDESHQSERDGDSDREAEESQEDDDDDDDDEEEEEEEVYFSKVRDARKQSVVSVSTTISMKSEAMSPPPPLNTSHRHSMSEHNSAHASHASPTAATANFPSNSKAFEDALHQQQQQQQDQQQQQQQHNQHNPSLEEFPPPPFYRSLLLLAEMSSKDNLLTPPYTAACVTHARQHREFVMGFIAQRSLNCQPDDNFITMTPGVQLAVGKDALGQQYNTPTKVVTEGGSDIVIVGRGILGAPDRRKAAEEYRIRAWGAYEERVFGRAGAVAGGSR